MKCTICNKELTGLQTKFCSRKCHNKCFNRRQQDYKQQQKRGHIRKVRLIDMHGGKCEICGYSKYTGALHFHHLDPSQKLFQLDIRKCSNSTWESLLKESAKCQVLCANCHAEVERDKFLALTN